jgi:hypothetical protein
VCRVCRVDRSLEVEDNKSPLQMQVNSLYLSKRWKLQLASPLAWLWPSGTRKLIPCIVNAILAHVLACSTVLYVIICGNQMKIKRSIANSNCC